MVQAAASGMEPGGLHGFAWSLTSFVGRADEISEVAELLGEYRLVTVTGPGGVGKTRLSAEVARRVAGRYADGVWLVELATAPNPAMVPSLVAAALGVPQLPEVSVTASLAGVLSRQQLLLVLDNCEHVAGAVSELCETLLLAADDIRVLTTSREPVGVAGESRYRLGTLTLLESDDLADAGRSEAVALFADRARRVDPHFTLTGKAGQNVARLVKQLDGMPLAIELAAAQVESLGLEQLLDRLDSRLALLAGADRMAVARHHSLGAAVDWSYQLLAADEQLVFRRLGIFPGPFSLEGAEAVAGKAAGPVVLRLVNCSLLLPPRARPDGRSRYVMLETLRAYATERLEEGGEQAGAAAALASYALRTAEKAAAEMEASSSELDAARWFDAEDATMQQSLAWAQEQDPPTAVRLAVALATWWQLRGRTVAGYALLRAAAGRASAGNHTPETKRALCVAQLWLGHLACATHDHLAARGHYDAVLDSLASDEASPVLVGALIGRSSVLRNLGRLPQAAQDAGRALDSARELVYPAGQTLALTELALAAHLAGDHETLLRRAREACWTDPASVPGTVVRRREYVLMIALSEAGDIASARQSCAVGLARAREAGDVQSQAAFLDAMVHLDVRAGRLPSAGAHLREAIEIALQAGDRLRLTDCLEECGNLCAAQHRWGEAVTMWSAYSACLKDGAASDVPADVPGVTKFSVMPLSRRQEAGFALGSPRTREAEKRGAAMTLDTAAEFAIMICAPTQQAPPDQPGIPQLSPREQELVILVATGHTDGQIAARLHISVRTVSSHLDRIRDKTGCRRRADLTRLALQAGLV